jgi:hypothetical protein
MICAKNPREIMDCIEDMYTIKDIGPSAYYFGNDGKKDSKG